MSTQSRIVSAIEQVTTTTIGLIVAIGTQLVVLPLFGLKVTFSQNLQMAGIFTVVSLIRGYFVRRMFNRFHAKLERWVGN